MSDKKLTVDEVADRYDGESMLKADGFDDCLMGVVSRFGQPYILCYSREAMLEKMVERDGMSYDEAVEFFEFNILGAWVGDGTPCFIEKVEDMAV